MLLLADDAGEKVNCLSMMGLAMEHTKDYSAAMDAYSRALVLP
jgi:hypothetical protein